MKHCTICPRKCNIDRENSIGFCGVKNEIVISKIMIHTGEEPILTNEKDKGSGTIFFSGCNLKCVYCQNYDISHAVKGKTFTVSELVDIFKTLENKGAGNIDLVTPTHYSTQIIEALKIYKPKVPVIWNSSGYESVETLKQLEGLVDIFLVDFKYSDNNLAKLYSKTPNYNQITKNAIMEMKKQQPHNIFKENKLLKGIIVRHMILPSHTKDSTNVLSEIKQLLGNKAIVSIMSQYVPMGNAKLFPEINKKITPLEYKIVINHANKLGFANAFIQDLESSTDSYTPNFNSQLFEF